MGQAAQSSAISEYGLDLMVQRIMLVYQISFMLLMPKVAILEIWSQLLVRTRFQIVIESF